MDDNFDDYFMEDGRPPEQPPVRRETPQEREEREIAEATIERRHDTLRLLLITVIVVMAAGIIGWAWARYWHPCEQGQYKGWILHLAAQGSVFRTFEGQMLTTAYADDSVARRDTLRFTIASDTVARQAMSWSADGRRLVISYDRYRGALLWRGASTLVVTAIDMDSDRVERLPAPQTE